MKTDSTLDGFDEDLCVTLPECNELQKYPFLATILLDDNKFQILTKLMWGLMMIRVIGTRLMRHMNPGNSLTRAPLYSHSYLTQGSYNMVPYFSTYLGLLY